MLACSSLIRIRLGFAVSGFQGPPRLPHSRAARKVVIYAPSRPLARDGARLHSPSIPRAVPGKGKGPLEGALSCASGYGSAPCGRDALSSHGLNRSTFGDEGLNCRVRDGFGWDPLSMVAPAGGGPLAEFYSSVKRPLGAAWRALRGLSGSAIAVIGDKMKSSAD